MTDAPDFKTIDFAEYLSGQSKPKDSETVILNEKIAYDAHRLLQRRSELDPADDAEEIAGINASLEALYKESKNHEFTFYLTAVDREMRDEVRQAIREKYELKPDVFGRVETPAEAEREYTSKIWALHTERIEGPDGIRIVAPTPENLAGLIAKAPDIALQKIDAKIGELQGTGATDGFMALVEDADFLSQR